MQLLPRRYCNSFAVLVCQQKSKAELHRYHGKEGCATQTCHPCPRALSRSSNIAKNVLALLEKRVVKPNDVRVLDALENCDLGKSSFASLFSESF